MASDDVSVSDNDLVLDADTASEDVNVSDNDLVLAAVVDTASDDVRVSVRDCVNGFCFIEIKERAYGPLADKVQPMSTEFDVAFCILSVAVILVDCVPP